MSRPPTPCKDDGDDKLFANPLAAQTVQRRSAATFETEDEGRSSTPSWRPPDLQPQLGKRSSRRKVLGLLNSMTQSVRGRWNQDAPAEEQEKRNVDGMFNRLYKLLDHQQHRSIAMAEVEHGLRQVQQSWQALIMIYPDERGSVVDSSRAKPEDICLTVLPIFLALALSTGEKLRNSSHGHKFSQRCLDLFAEEPGTVKHLRDTEVTRLLQQRDGQLKDQNWQKELEHEIHPLQKADTQWTKNMWKYLQRCMSDKYLQHVVLPQLEGWLAIHSIFDIHRDGVVTLAEARQGLSLCCTPEINLMEDRGMVEDLLDSMRCVANSCTMRQELLEQLSALEKVLEQHSSACKHLKDNVWPQLEGKDIPLQRLSKTLRACEREPYEPGAPMLIIQSCQELCYVSRTNRSIFSERAAIIDEQLQILGSAQPLHSGHKIVQLPDQVEAGATRSHQEVLVAHLKSFAGGLREVISGCRTLMDNHSRYYARQLQQIEMEGLKRLVSRRLVYTRVKLLARLSRRIIETPSAMCELERGTQGVRHIWMAKLQGHRRMVLAKRELTKRRDAEFRGVSVLAGESAAGTNTSRELKPRAQSRKVLESKAINDDDSDLSVEYHDWQAVLVNYLIRVQHRDRINTVQGNNVSSTKALRQAGNSDPVEVNDATVSNKFAEEDYSFPRVLLVEEQVNEKLQMLRQSMKEWSEMLMIMDVSESGGLSPLELRFSLMALSEIGVLTEERDQIPLDGSYTPKSEYVTLGLVTETDAPYSHCSASDIQARCHANSIEGPLACSRIWGPHSARFEDDPSQFSLPPLNVIRHSPNSRSYQRPYSHSWATHRDFRDYPLTFGKSNLDAVVLLGNQGISLERGQHGAMGTWVIRVEFHYEPTLFFGDGNADDPEYAFSVLVSSYANNAIVARRKKSEPTGSDTVQFFFMPGNIFELPAVELAMALEAEARSPSAYHVEISGTRHHELEQAHSPEADDSGQQMDEIVVQSVESEAISPEFRTVHVNGLPTNQTEAALTEKFSEYGGVVAVTIRSRGSQNHSWALVTFSGIAAVEHLSRSQTNVEVFDSEGSARVLQVAHFDGAKLDPGESVGGASAAVWKQHLKQLAQQLVQQNSSTSTEWWHSSSTLSVQMRVYECAPLLSGDTRDDFEARENESKFLEPLTLPGDHCQACYCSRFSASFTDVYSLGNTFDNLTASSSETTAWSLGELRNFEIFLLARGWQHECEEDQRLKVPGKIPSDIYQNPTPDLRTVLNGVTSGHLGQYIGGSDTNVQFPGYRVETGQLWDDKRRIVVEGRYKLVAHLRSSFRTQYVGAAGAKKKQVSITIGHVCFNNLWQIDHDPGFPYSNEVINRKNGAFVTAKSEKTSILIQAMLKTIPNIRFHDGTLHNDREWWELANTSIQLDSTALFIMRGATAQRYPGLNVIFTGRQLHRAKLHMQRTVSIDTDQLRKALSFFVLPVAPAFSWLASILWKIVARSASKVIKRAKGAKRTTATNLSPMQTVLRALRSRTGTTHPHTSLFGQMLLWVLKTLSLRLVHDLNIIRFTMVTTRMEKYLIFTLNITIWISVGLTFVGHFWLEASPLHLSDVLIALGFYCWAVLLLSLEVATGVKRLPGELPYELAHLKAQVAIGQATVTSMEDGLRVRVTSMGLLQLCCRLHFDELGEAGEEEEHIEQEDSQGNVMQNFRIGRTFLDVVWRQGTVNSVMPWLDSTADSDETCSVDAVREFELVEVTSEESWLHNNRAATLGMMTQIDLGEPSYVALLSLTCVAAATASVGPLARWNETGTLFPANWGHGEIVVVASCAASTFCGVFVVYRSIFCVACRWWMIYQFQQHIADIVTIQGAERHHLPAYIDLRHAGNLEAWCQTREFMNRYFDTFVFDTRNQISVFLSFVVMSILSLNAVTSYFSDMANVDWRDPGATHSLLAIVFVYFILGQSLLAMEQINFSQIKLLGKLEDVAIALTSISAVEQSILERTETQVAANLGANENEEAKCGAKSTPKLKCSASADISSLGEVIGTVMSGQASIATEVAKIKDLAAKITAHQSLHAEFAYLQGIIAALKDHRDEKAIFGIVIDRAIVARLFGAGCAVLYVVAKESADKVLAQANAVAPPVGIFGATADGDGNEPNHLDGGEAYSFLPHHEHHLGAVTTCTLVSHLCYSGRALVPLVDPSAVEAAFAVGVGGQLGSAAAPKVQFTQMDPTVGQVTRMWNDYLGSTGKPLGLRGSAQNLSQYCGFDNANGPSGPRAGNWGPVAFLRILNPPNSLSNVDPQITCGIPSTGAG